MALRDHVNSVLTHTIQCTICDLDCTVEGGTRVNAAREFKVLGWVETETDILCPDHAKED